MAETGSPVAIRLAADVLTTVVGFESSVAAQKRVLLSKSMRATTKRREEEKRKC